jgi:hypothetical protein
MIHAWRAGAAISEGGFSREADNGGLAFLGRNAGPPGVVKLKLMSFVWRGFLKISASWLPLRGNGELANWRIRATAGCSMHE